MTRSEKWFTILGVLFATCAVYDVALIVIEASKPAVADDAPAFTNLGFVMDGQLIPLAETDDVELAIA